MTVKTLFGPIEIEVDEKGIVTEAPPIYGWWIGKKAILFEAAVSLVHRRLELPRRKQPAVAAELLYKQGRLLL